MRLRANRHSVWLAAAWNILLVLVLYTLMRLFFYAIHTDWYPEMTKEHLGEILWGGIRFDLSALLYLNSLYLVLMLIPIPRVWRSRKGYKAVCKWVYLLPNAIGITANCIDMVYTAFSDRRTTFAFFSEFQNDGNLLSIFGQGMVGYWYVTLLGAGLLAALYFLYREGEAGENWPRWWYYPIETLCFAGVVYMSVIGIRGGFGAWTRPINMSNANQYANTSRETMLVLNTPFSLMQTLESEVYTDPHYYEHPEEWVSPIHQAADREAKGISVKKNVVVIIAESFSKDFVGFYRSAGEEGERQGFTPFLDSLCAQSVTYKYSYASGRKSIDAMPSILSSIPSLIQPYVLTPFSANAVSSLARCLRDEGYHTGFFHGAPNGSMGFQAYAHFAGFAQYYGMDEYDGEPAFDGTWALWDEEFLDYFGRMMDTIPEPFMTTVFTASSHHPFKVPARYEGVFPTGSDPLHKCIGYSDMALRKFFDYARQQPWFEHTLFVFSADHTNYGMNAEYNQARGLYSIPIFFYEQGMEPRLDTTNVISQTDIMPSVLEYLGYDKDYFAWGENAFTRDKQHNWAICYNYPYFQLMTKNGLLLFDGENVVLDTTGDADALPYLKAYIQDYIERMIGNRLRVD